MNFNLLNKTNILQPNKFNLIILRCHCNSAQDILVANVKLIKLPSATILEFLNPQQYYHAAAQI